jgi:hypothetical protein
VQAVVLADRDTATVRAGEGLDLDTVDGAKDVFVSSNWIEEGNLAFVTLEIEI